MGSGAAFNIGTGREPSIREIFETMSEVVGYGQQPGYGPARKGDVVRIVLDPSRAYRELGWQATMPLYDGLSRTYAFFRDRRRYRVRPIRTSPFCRAVNGTACGRLAAAAAPNSFCSGGNGRSFSALSTACGCQIEPERILIVTEACMLRTAQATARATASSIIVEPTRCGRRPLCSPHCTCASEPRGDLGIASLDAFIADDEEFRRTLAARRRGFDGRVPVTTASSHASCHRHGYPAVRRTQVWTSRYSAWCGRRKAWRRRSLREQWRGLWNRVFVWKTTLFDAYQQFQPRSTRC
jgi:hypothetical protein